MTISTKNQYLKRVLEDLIASHETEIDYLPLEVELKPEHITEEDINTVLSFVSEPRKRLFVFKLENNPNVTEHLFFRARRAFLNQLAEINLQRASHEPQINPLKKELNNPPSLVRAAIQIQKSVPRPKQVRVLKAKQKEQVHVLATTDIISGPLDELAVFPNLTRQLQALNIHNVQDTALQTIKEHAHAFTDGIIPGNLPKGFYIDYEKQTLCYTNTPHRLPSALAPVLKKPNPVNLPAIEQLESLLPTVSKPILENLLANTQPAQKEALIAILPAHAREIGALVSLLRPADADFVVPLLVKLFIFGGEAHMCLFMQLLKTCINKNINIEFLKDQAAQNEFLIPQGLKNLQKLLQLTIEQREWWNALTAAHLRNEQHHFDFNAFFEAYTQIFLAQVTEKNLTLPHPCPIQHDGHFLITLNRVMEVLERAKNPQEQCLHLRNLDWGPIGAHYAMTQVPKATRFQHVAECMKLKNPEDTSVNLEAVYQQIEDEQFDLNAWLYRFIGQHWKSEIRLSDIQAQFIEIQTTPAWSKSQKNQLWFILACGFADDSPVNTDNWKKTLKQCISLLQSLEENDRSDLLKALARCFKFKPCPSLVQIQQLIEQCIELKTSFPERNFKNELLIPFLACLENEGFEIINTLQVRGQKLGQEHADQLKTMVAFATLLQTHRQNLSPDSIKLLAALNEPELAEQQVLELKQVIEDMQAKKGAPFGAVLLSLLAKINIAKSQALPNVQQIQILIRELADLSAAIPDDCKSIEKQEHWLKDLIISRNGLPGCVLGSGDISKLDDLIVDALVDAIKKRSSVLKINVLKESLGRYLQSNLVPAQLREQLNRELWPLLDALEELIVLLQKPNVQFEEILEKFKFFEERKTMLLEGVYSVGPLGESKGEYLLSFLLTGERKEADNKTGRIFASVLAKVHGLIREEIIAFFNDEKNKSTVKDLDAATSLKWLAAFNDTHTVNFLFEEELVQKKVLPAIRKTLVQLNTQDAAFEESILRAAAELAKDKPSDHALQEYKMKIESIASYLNLLIDIKDKFALQFSGIYTQLNTGALARLNYSQKRTLVNTLLTANPESLDLYLKLTTAVLDENPEADEAAIERAVNSLKTLFELEGLEAETQIMFFKMSMNHNLRNVSPFPLTILNELKQANLDEESKSLIIKQIIQILRQMPDSESPETIRGLIQQTQIFLTENREQASLCIALLKRVSLQGFSRDIGSYSDILRQLASPAKEYREEKKARLIRILTSLAQNHKDDTVTLPMLLDLTKRLGSLSPVDIERVLQLFATPPYPIAEGLYLVLLAPGSEKLQPYCQSFDTNPFAKTGEARALEQQFSTARIKEALVNLQDLMHGVVLPHSLQLQLARQLSYIDTLGYIDPLNPYDFQGLKKLTACSRQELKERANFLLGQLRTHSFPSEQLELVHMELLAYLREIYFRSTGLFPNSTQMLVLLLSLHSPDTNLLMRIETGEGKSLLTPILAVLQWAQGGTVDVCTANGTLLSRDYENSCAPFFKFLGIKSALIRANSQPEEYQLNGINCSTGEDMSLFRQATKEAGKEACVQNKGPIHFVIDESDDALLDQNTLNKLVAEIEEKEENNPAQWIYPLTYQFINLPMFRNTDPALGKVWDEEEDIDQFRLFINKEINEKFNGDADKQNFIAAASNTQLKEWIRASCKAALLVENKHFIVRPIKEKDETGNEITKKIVCVPLVKSIPKGGCIFTDGVQQALQARLIAERKDQARYFVIDAYPPVLSSQSIQTLIRFYQWTKGRILGISGTPGDPTELQYLATLLGTQAIGVAPHAGDKRIKHSPVFTFSRKETIQAIHKAIDNIKRPVTKPHLEFDADIPTQTLEEREGFIRLKEDALRNWSHTQTQPVLIVCEDFDEAQNIGKSFADYQKAGFKIQVVTGKESPEELDRIIKQAGQANTITIGTAMLARGIDVNPGDHPEGLFVIQPCIASERMTTQIAGRAARNGKPGQWLPIYQVEPPTHWLEKVMYFIFPWYRQRKCQATVAELQEEIKTQANVDRLYTQAIDHAQQTLMHQIYAWESLLLELYPTDPQVRSELYQWRETVLSELTQAQETSVSEETLESSITQFQNALCKIWGAAKEEKWLAKAQKAPGLTPRQNLQMNYLKQLDLSQELKIQRALEQKRPPFAAGAEVLTHFNLDAAIHDKAGAVLEFTHPTEEVRERLELAQVRQLLPCLIGELCSFYPDAIPALSSPDKSKLPPLILEVFASLLNKVIGKNKISFGASREEIIQSITRSYQDDLKQADIETIRELLNKIKPLILDHDQSEKTSIVDKFKMQGIILTFSNLYEQSGLTADADLTQLKSHYSREIMKLLADFLLNEFAWVKEDPQPLTAFLEREVAINAAEMVYDIAEKVCRSPGNEERIHELFACLKNQRIVLQDKYLFSIGHRNPREVINTALAAIEALNMAPHCDREFQEQCHDKVLFTYHLRQFSSLLRQVSLSFRNTEDPVWKYLETKLVTIINTSENQSHVIIQLYEAVERFSTYPAYLPYRNTLSKMKELLAGSVSALNDDNGLKKDSLEGLFTQKNTHLASLLDLNENQIRIQSGCDGMRSYIEIQVQNAPVIEGFTGYSTCAATLEGEKRRLTQQRETFEQNRESFLNLSRRDIIETLSPIKRAEFERLFKWKQLLVLDWNQGLEEATVSEFPDSIQKLYNHAEQARQWVWPISLIEPGQLREVFGEKYNTIYGDLLEQHTKLCKALQSIQERKRDAEQIVEEKRKAILGKESREKELDEGGFREKFANGTEILALKLELPTLRGNLIKAQKTVEELGEHERDCLLKLQKVNEQLEEKKRPYVSMRKEQAQLSLEEHIQVNSKALTEALESEFKEADTAFEQLVELEAVKSCYQTRRFDNVSELLRFEASLAQEASQIPVMSNRASRTLDRLFTFFDRGSLAQSMAEGEALISGQGKSQFTPTTTAI